MKLHSDTLTKARIMIARNRAENKGHIANDVYLYRLVPAGSRTRAHGFEVRMGTDEKAKGDGRRRTQDNEAYSASWDEWGWFIAELYAMDENMVFGPYKGYDDFLRKTRYKFDI